MTTKEKLLKEIKLLSDSIRNKQRALKMDISQRDEYLQQTFQPVVAPLKEISRQLGQKQITESDLIMPLKSENIENKSSIKADTNQSETEVSDSSSEQESEIENEQQSDIREKEESNLTLLSRDMQDQGELSRKYVVKMLHGTIANRVHHVYGARLEKTGLRIGNSDIKIDDSENIVINNKVYPGTEGLFELIFKKIPMKYNSKDLKIFKEICLATNLHKKNYRSDSPIHKGASVKYKHIISKLFPSTKGRGISFKSAKNSNIIYYNNINKLVDRMRLLYEAQLVGHTGVGNEIVALTEELRQRGFIE